MPRYEAARREVAARITVTARPAAALRWSAAALRSERCRAAQPPEGAGT